MKSESAQYVLDLDGTKVSITAVIDGRNLSILLNPASRYYAEIMKQVKEGTLTIKDAD